MARLVLEVTDMEDEAGRRLKLVVDLAFADGWDTGPARLLPGPRF